MHLQLVAHDRRAWPASLHGIYGSCRGARSSARMWCFVLLFVWCYVLVLLRCGDRPSWPLDRYIYKYK